MNDKVVPLSKKDPSSDDKLDRLAAHLGNSLVDRKPVFAPFLRSAIWASLSCVYLFSIMQIFSVNIRGDAGYAMWHSSLGVDTILAVLMFVSSICCATLLMVPQNKSFARKIVLAPASLFAVFILWSIYRIYSDSHDGALINHISEFHGCFWSGFYFIAVPAALAVLFARRGASTSPLLLHFVSFIVIFSLGWLSLRLTCGIDHAGHAFVFHFLPYLLLGSISGAVSRFLFRTI